MKWKSNYISPTQQTFEIKHDMFAGYYMYVDQGDKNTHDFLQDTLYDAQNQALEEYGVPIESWKRVE